MSIELMLNAVNLTFVAFAHMWHQVNGQIFVFFVMVVAAAEAAVGLAIIIAIFRTRETLNVDSDRPDEIMTAIPHISGSFRSFPSPASWSTVLVGRKLPSALVDRRRADLHRSSRSCRSRGSGSHDARRITAALRRAASAPGSRSPASTSTSPSPSTTSP